MNKSLSKNNIKSVVDKLKAENKKIVFTNGCFDIVHLGHLKLLQKCKEFGTVILGLNSDSSIKKLKGETRPINDELYRVEFLSHLEYVDYIIVFDEDTPEKLIEEISPDYLIKGSDYIPEEIVGYRHVTSYGGKVLTFGFDVNQSTTNIIHKTNEQDLYSKKLKLRANVYTKLLNDNEFKNSIQKAIFTLKDCFNDNGKLFVAGNGGSAEQANHFVAELMGHFKTTTKVLPAISLCENLMLITALSNDYSYSEIFKRSLFPLALKNDCLFLLSTSGNSKNIIEALTQAKDIGLKTILLTSTLVDKKVESLTDVVIKACCNESDLTQEIHLFVMHYLSEMLKSE